MFRALYTCCPIQHEDDHNQGPRLVSTLILLMPILNDIHPDELQIR
jgi:hypothetical protein